MRWKSTRVVPSRYIAAWVPWARWSRLTAASDRYFQEDAKKLVPEGVEGRVPFKGPLADTVFQMVGGLRSSMGYCGAKDIDALRRDGEFIRITNAGLQREPSPRYLYHPRSA